MRSWQKPGEGLFLDEKKNNRYLGFDVDYIITLYYKITDRLDLEFKGIRMPENKEYN